MKPCVASVMSAYNSVNGEWCGQHRGLLTDILRDEWGFEGVVISDYGAVGELHFGAGRDVADLIYVSIGPGIGGGFVVGGQLRRGHSRSADQFRRRPECYGCH